MFSKSKKQKSEAIMQQPKLRGMPALKHMRSTKREEYLLKKTKKGMPSISDLEQQNERQDIKTTGQFDDEIHMQMKVYVVPASSHKSPSEVHLLGNSSAPVAVKYAERNTDCMGSDIVIYENATPPITKKVDYHEKDLGGSPTSNSSWRLSKGDSGYKSQGDSYNGQDKKKTKKTKRKNEARSQATSGLHDIKQQRKASRESVSQSMRALTPKERESIRFLENVIKTANENDSSFSADEVFKSDSEGNNNLDASRNSSCTKISEDTDEAIDYGYASVNDISRRFSIESMESVGSIIDLVGNLSTSASSSTSPLYVSADRLHQHPALEHDDTRTPGAVSQSDTHGDNSKILRWSDSYSREAKKHYEDVLSHFDEVINSFCIPTDEENTYEDGEEGITAQQVETVSVEKMHVVERSCATTSGIERKERKRKEKKYRDPDKEKERKERKKKKKEAKKALKRDQEHQEARLREENIARHVDTITALTQDMIMTVQQEPIYAKVDKTKKRKKDRNQNIETNEKNDTIDPPFPFANDHNVREDGLKKDCNTSSNQEVTNLNEKFNLTTTPLPSPESQKGNETPDGQSHRANDEHSESITNNLNYPNIITPSDTAVDISVLQLSPNLLHESTENLKHTTPCVRSGKSIKIKPKHFEHIPDEQASQDVDNNNATSATSSTNFSRLSQNSRTSRPLSLNLDTTEKSAAPVKPYSSFRKDKDGGGKRNNNNKTKPFVITALKKPLQLC